MSDAPPPRDRPGAARGGQASRSDYVGCGVWALGFLVLAVISFTVGIILRPDPPGLDKVTFTSGGGGESAYRIEGYRNEDDEPCLMIYVDDQETTGQCGTAIDTTPGLASEEAGRYLITSSRLPDGTTVAFAPVPADTATVVVPLSDGTEDEVEARTSETTGMQWFVLETDLEVTGPARMLDANGQPVPPPR